MIAASIYGGKPMTDESKTAGATAGDDESSLIQTRLTDRHARDAGDEGC